MFVTKYKVLKDKLKSQAAQVMRISKAVIKKIKRREAHHLVAKVKMWFLVAVVAVVAVVQNQSQNPKNLNPLKR